MQPPSEGLDGSRHSRNGASSHALDGSRQSPRHALDGSRHSRNGASPRNADGARA